MNAYLVAAQVAPDLTTSTPQLWGYAVALVTPLIIQGVRWLVPKVPTWLLPTLAPFVGIVVGLGLNAVGAAHLSWVDGAQLGALGVFVREITNQYVTKRMTGTTPTA
jgi:hypothetical protein